MLDHLKISMLCLVLLTACQPGLEQQPKIKEDRAPRPLPPGTVSYLAPSLQQPTLTRSLLEHGKERYEIYCSVCHGLTGEGDGLLTERGFTKPAPFQTDTNRALDSKKIEEIIAHGKEAMSGFANRLSSHDRWAVAAYVQALQLRAHFPVAKLRPQEGL